MGSSTYKSIVKGERMDELVKLVAGKVGISEAQAKQAVEVVMGFLKENLPAPIAGQIDAALKGDLSGLGDLAGSLGGLLGQK
jgi:uncharacterized protein (DUF2267 family)